MQPLQDTDVGGYLRIAHEQNLISTIEEARRETQDEFYRVLEERNQKDWEAKKKRVFEELGTRIGGPGGDKTTVEMRVSHSKGGLVVSPTLSISMPVCHIIMYLVCSRLWLIPSDAREDDGL